MTFTSRLAPVVASAAVLSLAACGSANPSNPASDAATSSAGGNDALTVFAAASLTDVMKKLTAKYSSEHPGTSFNVNYGASSTLVQQISSGADVDVLITADQSSIDSVKDSGVLAPGVAIVASNEIVLALAPDNPGNITSLADAVDGHRIAVCAPAVPCGKAAKRVLDADHLTLHDATQEPDVSAVRTKVSTGQVDAGFIYATDAKATQRQGVKSIALADPQPNKYPAALTRESAKRPAAVSFKEWLSGPEAAMILADAGFGPGQGPSSSSNHAAPSSSAPNSAVPSGSK